MIYSVMEIDFLPWASCGPRSQACLLVVKSGQTNAVQNRPLSVVTTIADKRGRNWVVR